MEPGQKRGKHGHADMRERICTPISRRWLLLSLALFFAGLNLMGQDPLADQKSDGFFNGRFWEKQTAGEKLAYVDGFVTGLSVAKSIAEDYVAPMNKQLEELVKRAVDAGLLVQIPQPEGAKPPETIAEAITGQFIVGRFTYGDYIQEIDKLYADRRNILLPIPVAIGYCRLKFIGSATNAQLEQYLIRRRTDASAAVEMKP
jgi:hypothetical protein